MSIQAVPVERVPAANHRLADAAAWAALARPGRCAGAHRPVRSTAGGSAPLHAGAPGTWFDDRAGPGDLAAARRGALHYLLAMRRSGGDASFKLQALMALAEYHFHGGRPDKGMNRLARLIARLRKAGSRGLAADASQRLARMHAACGDHAEALAWLRQARADRAARQDPPGHLHLRRTTLEHELQQRRAELQEAAAHRQRLAVVGRLMSDIHHALGQPIAQTHSTLAACVECVPPQGLAQALQQVIAQVDKATGLARQLKMFSYRAAPQAMVVGLHDRLLEAWDGVALWRGHTVPMRELTVSGELATQVRVDVQRLAVLLRILLIEADKAALLGARIARGSRFGRMQLICPADAGMGGGAEGFGAGDTSVGLTLCREIVHEMGGRLTRAAAGPGRLGFMLELPSR